ncbi:MAG: Gfo/Idh/MocA family oxidoreductase [Candidatus Cloacimonetes bacterium]|nr:Gfo/Idh/MocA family oxidoreductase [Candidatus Cloacimonadota bacterium]
MKRIGLIGCGIVTIKAHLPSLLNDPTQPLNDPEFVISAICGLEKDKLGYIKSKLPNVKVFSEYQALIKSGLVDCVLIATGEYLHLEIAEYALNKELFVLIEKPASTSSEKIETFIKKNKNNLDKLQVAFNKRFYPGILKTIELQSTGEFNKIIGGNIYFFTQQGRKPGKYGILSNLIHLCDLISYLFGEPVEVSAHFSKVLNDEKKGKTLSASILTLKGVSVSMLFTSSSNWNLPYHEQIQILDNKKNHISIENNNSLKFTKYNENKKINTYLFEQSNSIFWNKDPYGYKTQITEFYKLASGQYEKPTVGIYDALAAHKLFERIFEFDEK